MLTLNDGRNELWQWDTGRKLTVDADCSQVHFSNKVFGRSIDVDVVDGTVAIPDVLLQVDNELIAWAFVGTPENGYTKISKVFKVNKRNKPANYVFTPTEQTTLGQIMERLDDLEAMQDPDAIKNAVEDYLEQNPVESPVQSVNGQTGTVELTANDVGAISQDDLQAATNEALAQAKASGEFDGPQGPEGQQGPAGPAGAGMDITGATVGQIVKIKAVDENGKPTEWEAADMVSGGGGENWRLVKSVKLTGDVTTIEFTQDSEGNAFALKKYLIIGVFKGATGNSSGGYAFLETKSNAVNQKIRIAAIPDTVPAASGTRTFAINGELCGRRLKGYFTSAADGTSENNPYVFTFLSDRDYGANGRNTLNPIADFTISTSGSLGFGSGTYVEVWGVDA